MIVPPKIESKVIPEAKLEELVLVPEPVAEPIPEIVSEINLEKNQQDLVLVPELFSKSKPEIVSEVIQEPKLEELVLVPEPIAEPIPKIIREVNQEENKVVNTEVSQEEAMFDYKVDYEKENEAIIPQIQPELQEIHTKTPITKTRKISVIVSPKTLDNLINTKVFKEELEEIFRKIINNLEFLTDKKHKLVRTKKVKELENIKNILLKVLSNISISLDEKDLVETFLEDVLNNDSFYRKEIINALDSIELVYPLKMLGFSDKVSLIKDVIEWKEINSLIWTILSRIENLIVYKRFERKRIQKYYIEDEEAVKINKIISEFFNWDYTKITEIAFNIRNEIWNTEKQKDLFTKIAERLNKFEYKYRKLLEESTIDNKYTVTSIFDVMVSYIYNIDTKIIYVETFNLQKIA